MRYQIRRKREPRHCEICEALLRSNYKSDERVCSQPKIEGTTQSLCQQALARKRGWTTPRQDTAGRKCLTCGKVMDMVSNANQKYCKRPLYLRRYFIDFKTDCEKTAQRKQEAEWQKNHKNGNFANPKSGYYPSVKLPEPTWTKRRCMGVLSNEDEGEHYFMSSGPENRICDQCKNAVKHRQIDTNSRVNGARIWSN